MTRWFPVAAVVIAIACGGGGREAPAPRPASGPVPAMKASRGERNWRIRSGAVGDVELDKPLPRDLLEGDLEGRYRARFIADAQPWEGFELADSPLVVGIGSGPFTGEAEPDLAALRGPAAAAARRGAPVTSIQVRGPGPATEAGIAVGSSLAAVRGAYPDLSLGPVPPTLGDDECVATTTSLDGVFFMFRSCRAAEAGEPVTRIDLRRP